jgi:hypothetical protein
MGSESGHKLFNGSGHPAERSKHVVLVKRRRLQPILHEVSGKFILIVMTLGSDICGAEVSDGLKRAPVFFETGLVDARKPELPETRVASSIFPIGLTQHIDGLVQARADVR